MAPAVEGIVKGKETEREREVQRERERYRQRERGTEREREVQRERERYRVRYAVTGHRDRGRLYCSDSFQLRVEVLLKTGSGYRYQ